MLPWLPLADVWDWIVPAIVVFVFVLNYLWSMIQGTQQQQQQRNQRPNQPRPNQGRPNQGQGPAQAERPLPQPGGAGQAKPQSELNAEIEQFLRRANERRAEKSKRGGGKQQQPAAQPSARQPSAAQQAKQEAKPRRGFDSVAESVRDHLGSRRLEQHAQTLGQEVVRADSQFEQHLQDAFNHRLGTLGDASPAAPATDAAASEPTQPAITPRAVAGIALDPASIRQAVLLKEILERPVDRW